MAALSSLFPEGDFRLHLTLRKADARAFFASQDDSGDQLTERRRWLAEAPTRYAALQADGVPACQEFAALCGQWGIHISEGPVPSDAANDVTTMISLGRALAPDLLLLARDNEGRFRLRGGALCFPTGWALEEKLGHPIDFIHSVVPGLNATLGSPIQQFLTRLKPGVAFLRDNWGLAASAELNLHPARGIAAPTLPVSLDQLWLRVEHQALLALPRSGGIVFGIRIALHRLDVALREAGVATGLHRALETMPDAMAEYKRLHQIRAELVERLAALNN